MDRREFLKTTVAGAAATTIAGASHASSEGSSPPQPSLHYDTIVIGGGFAGVTAARELSIRGRKTLLLEATNRLGGRTFTSSFAGHDIELGGSYVHWTQPFVWAEIERYGLEIEPSMSAPPEFFAIPGDRGPRRITPEQALQIMSDGFAEFCEGAQRLFPSPFKFLSNEAFHAMDHLTVADRLQQMTLSPEGHHLIRGFLNVNVHNLPENGGLVDQLRWYAIAGFDTPRLIDSVSGFQVATGMKSLLDAMLSDSEFEVKTGSPVWKVNQASDRVQIETDFEEIYTADTVVAAVPMNVLEKIEFRPGLNEAKMNASKENHAGAGTKVYAKIRGTVDSFMGWAAEPHALSVCWRAYQDADSAIVVGYGPSPELLDVNDQRSVEAAFRDFLPDAEVIESYGYDWNLDPYIEGTWATARAGQLSKYARGMREPEGRIYFAGGDNAEGWRGFVDGAIETGIQAARDVLARGPSKDQA